MKIVIFFSLLLSSFLSKSIRTTEWSADLLYEFASKKIKNGEEKLQFMIIDPDKILSEKAKVKILEKMKNFYFNHTVINYLIIFNAMSEEEVDLETLVSHFSSKMNRGFDDYNVNNVLISAFAIDIRKSRLTTGKVVRNRLSDSKALKILLKRRTQLRLQNYDKAMEDLIDDINRYYGKSIFG